MGRPLGSKNKPKGKVEAKAKAKAKPLAKKSTIKSQEPPDWLRKAMAPSKTKQKPGPRIRAVKEKAQAVAKARKGKKPMANITKDNPLPAPETDPDFGVSAKPGVKPDQSLPTPPKKHGPTPLVEEQVVEPEPLLDEVAAGEPIPAENAEMLIAGTLGGSGDHHASAKRILERMVDEANWVITKGPDDTPAGMALKAKREAREKAEKEAREKDAKGKDAKGKTKGKEDERKDDKRY